MNGYSTTCPVQELRQAGGGKSTRTMINEAHVHGAM